MENEWISVKERLPEECVNCLVIDSRWKQPQVAYWLEGSLWENVQGHTVNVDHWMPLPAAPYLYENLENPQEDKPATQAEDEYIQSMNDHLESLGFH